MKTNTQVAQTIASQIGHRALYMIGAKNLCASEDRLVMKIGRNSGGWNYLRIVLNGLDLYDMTFQRVRSCKIAEEITVNNIYCDQLCEIIESHTGFYTSL